MQSNFPLFGLTHWLILLSVPSTAWILRRAGGSSVAAAKRVRILLGLFLLVNELGWYGFKLYKGWFSFPHGLPLQLCDLTLWLTVGSAIWLKQWMFEFAFFTGLAGTTMALITPDLWEPWPSYPTIYFFVAHGGVVVTLLYLWWNNQLAPQPGCVWRVMGTLNVYAAAIGAFNALFGANYMYLCSKPKSASLLDYLGPWPLYIASGELLALALFWLLWLPFSRRKDGRSGSL